MNDGAFKILTGHAPFPWQRELYRRFVASDIPRTVSLPTGLGKTSIVAIWLLAWLDRPDQLPRRLVYVVNRRTVVDQTTAELLRLRENLPGLGRSKIETLAISTLRGQFADNQEWSADPSRPAVICGTVDMIGSRLLFSGYRIGFKSRPLHAGFLGQDALLVHDEAHLEPAFQRLIEKIAKEQHEEERTGSLPWPKLRVMALSATVRSDGASTEAAQGSQFELTEREKQVPGEVPDPPTEPIHHVWRRLKAKKSLVLCKVAEAKGAVAKRIAKLAADYKNSDSAVVVFSRTLTDIEIIEKELVKTKRPVVLLTGTMRGKERDELVETDHFKRFLKGAARGETVYLLCTSAGEVGVDVSADHMVCDLSTLESTAQRLGRVNRFGDGDARIDVVYPAEFDKRDRLTPACENTLKLLQHLPLLPPSAKEPNIPRHDASPKALGELQGRSDLPCKIGDAFSPKPTMLDATDILFDAWALTTIREEMPGRPEVAPYLHGIADELPQTTIAWRAELDLIDTESPHAAKFLQAIFTKHRVRPHETLTVGMVNQRGKWKFRATAFLEEVVAKHPDLCETNIAVLFPHGLRLVTVAELISNPGWLNAEPLIILPGSFGGLNEMGILDAGAVAEAKGFEVESDSTADDDGLPLEDNGRIPSSTLDIADHDGYERYDGAPTRIRLLTERSDDGWTAHAIPGGKPVPADWRLEPVYGTSAELLNAIRRQSGLIIRLVQSLAFDDDGDSVSALVALSPAPPRTKGEEQTLDAHVDLVKHEAQRLADALRLEEPFRSVLLFAAAWHDLGKMVDRWQRYIGGPDDEGQPLGKSSKWRDPKLLAGYRHEFGSLLRVAGDQARHYFSDPKRNLTPEQQEQAQELGLHLIAAHHGYARPHFLNALDDDFNTAACEQTHIGAIRRYARLQRRYGRWGLAYLESLLRAADAAASRAVGLDPETDDDDATDANGADT